MAGRKRGEAHEWIFKVHLLVGLTAGLILALAGLSGSALVFREEIDALLYPELIHVEPEGERVSVQRVLELVQRANPDALPARIRIPLEPHDSYIVTLQGEEGRLVFVDPYRETILGSRRSAEMLTGFLFAWHSTLLGGGTGKTVLGLVALLLLVLVATGVIVWWPGVRPLRDVISVRWKGNWKRTNYDLHRAAGIWSTGFLLVMAVTGASLIFHQAFLAGLNRVTGSPSRPPAPLVTPKAGAIPLPLDVLVASASRALPSGTVTYITLPAKPDGPVTVRKRFDDELHPNGRSFIDVDPWTGEVLAVENALRAPVGSRAYNVLYPIHIGRWGGRASQLLHLLLGLSPVVLFVSGTLMWWNRRRRPPAAPARAKSRRHAAGAAARLQGS